MPPFDLADIVLEHDFKVFDVGRLFPRKPTINILIVADTAVSFTSSFGVGRVIDLIRENVDSYVNFQIDLARLGTDGSNLSVTSSPGPKDPKFTNFRFSSEVGGSVVIDDYDQIWCFGFAPGNDGSDDDNNIWNSPYASTDADLAKLTTWMNAGGGVLAMGDHHYLGAAMCAKIPRVGTMRRWTNAQGVPPISGTARFDSTRPAVAGSFQIGSQSDSVPQPMEWKRYDVHSLLWRERRFRPHPILCGGDNGVIDVMPDHAHEGFIFSDAEVVLNQNYNFSGVTGPEYPTIGSIQPKPETISWANTLPDPPYVFAKGDTPARRFGLIGVYDGNLANVGRIVVDSTWHHWMDVNLQGLESETPDIEFQKIARYYRNCAVWLSRENQRADMLLFASFWAINHANSFEDLTSKFSNFRLGGLAIDAAGRLTSDCLVREWIDIFIDHGFFERAILDDPGRFPEPNPCWSCPPIDFVREFVYGGIIEAIREERDSLFREAARGKKVKFSQKKGRSMLEKGAKLGKENLAEAFASNRLALEKQMKDLGLQKAKK